jgi:ATP phosphoribosyltransferase
MKPLRIALTKGRLEEKTIELFEKSGIDCASLRDKGRKLIFPLDDGKIEVMLVKSADVITYVEHGICDMGIVGKDTIMEYGHSFYEIADLGFGKCRMVLASYPQDFYKGYDKKVIATKFEKIAREYFSSKKLDIEIIKIEGSVELAPILGFADGIVDLVETGTTLKENGLVILEEICNVSARLIVNIAAMKMRKAEIEEFATKIGVNNNENI